MWRTLSRTWVHAKGIICSILQQVEVPILDTENHPTGQFTSISNADAITAAYNTQDDVYIDEQGHLFGLPLSQRILLHHSIMTAWLLAMHRATKLRLPNKSNATAVAKAQFAAFSPTVLPPPCFLPLRGIPLGALHPTWKSI